MQYSIQFEIASLALMCILFVRFLILPRFPSLSTRAFGWLNLMTIVYICSDIAGALLLRDIESHPFWVVYGVNWAFFIFQIIALFLVLLFVISLSTTSRNVYRKYWPIFIPTAICLGLVLLNPFTNMFFSFSEINGKLAYQTGPLVIIVYVHCMYTMIVALFMSQRNKHNILPEQRITIVAYTIVATIIIILQFMLPEYLITGSAIALSILMMTFTLQKPENMIDPESNVFNVNALICYLRDASTKGKTVYFIGIELRDVEKIANVLGIKARVTLIKEIGETLNEITRKDWVFRLNGPKFVVATDNNARYYELLNILTERLNNSWELNGAPISIMYSIRYHSENNFDDPEDVIATISASLDEIPDYDKGRVKPVNTESIVDAERRFNIEEELHNVLKRRSNGLFLVFQPIYDIKTERFTTAEVLCRIRSEKYGIIMPGEFIEVAEATGLVRKLDRMVLSKTCEFLSENSNLYKHGLENLHVNISGEEHFDRAQEKIDDVLSSYGVNPERICLEITETSAAENYKLVSEFMQNMSAKGYMIAMDDFGAGYSNMHSFVKLPFDTVKFDRSVLPSGNNEVSKLLFKDLVAMSKHTSKTVIIEGAETAEQCEFIKECGADKIQSFYYSKPLSEEDFITLMEQQ